MTQYIHTRLAYIHFIREKIHLQRFISGKTIHIKCKASQMKSQIHHIIDKTTALAQTRASLPMLNVCNQSGKQLRRFIIVHKLCIVWKM